MKEQIKINIEFSLAEIEVINTALFELPAKVSYRIIGELEKQTKLSLNNQGYDIINNQLVNIKQK